MHHHWSLCPCEYTHTRTSLSSPPIVRYLGNVLPAAVFGMLIIYCLKDTSFLNGSHGLPEIAGIIATVLLHLKFRQMLLSIGGGTAVYMTLIQFIFIP